MSQLSLFVGGGSKEARKARDKGIAAVTDNNLSWHDRALARLHRLAGSGLEMTGEEMRLFLLDSGLEPPTHCNAWGALTRHACLDGLIKDTGIVKNAATKKSHARRVVVWAF